MAYNAYKIELISRAEKQLAKIELNLRKVIIQELKRLSDLNSNLDIKKIENSDTIYRLRVRNYRIIYQLKENIFTILILKVCHRKEAYRNINNLIKQWDTA